jgi:hypothetical protein
LIALAIRDGEDPAKAEIIRKEVNALTARFPVYPEPSSSH